MKQARYLVKKYVQFSRPQDTKGKGKRRDEKPITVPAFD
jgi:hypothetical protein